MPNAPPPGGRSARSQDGQPTRSTERQTRCGEQERSTQPLNPAPFVRVVPPGVSVHGGHGEACARAASRGRSHHATCTTVQEGEGSGDISTAKAATKPGGLVPWMRADSLDANHLSPQSPGPIERAERRDSDARSAHRTAAFGTAGTETNLDFFTCLPWPKPYSNSLRNCSRSILLFRLPLNDIRIYVPAKLK